jgi:hypothetical protein
MKTYLTRLIVIVVLVAAGYWLWSNRDRIAVLSNNNVRIMGDWHKVYKLLRGSRIEITTNAAVTTYELSFPDDENMVWSLRKGEKVVPSVCWRR